MDQNALLLRAWAALRGAHDVLEQVLDDDDDAVLSETIIGGEGMTIEATQPEITRIEKLRREAFAEISRLSYKRSAEEAERFFDQLNWRDFKNNRDQAIVQFFGHPKVRQHDPKQAWRFEEGTREKIAEAQEVVALINMLHHAAVDSQPTVGSARANWQRRGVVTYIANARSECFAEVARLSSRPEETVAKLFDRINWQALRNERFREIERQLYPKQPQLDFDRRDTPGNQQEYTRQQRAVRNKILAERYAADAMRQILLLLQNLHGEIGANNTQRLAVSRQSGAQAV